MHIFTTVAELEDFVGRMKENRRSIGFVPTMGALHEGHISLVEKAVAENDVAIVSVFVNPTQFNNPRDLATYPRDEEKDARLLAQAGADAMFLPTVEEIYPDGPEARKVYDLGSVAEVMEGKYRPGHFQGVAQVVDRLLRLVRPDRAYFGEKDFQQIAVIRRMVEEEKLPVEIIPCPIRRADDGLALSSRNMLLTPEQRRVAPEIHRAMKESVDYSRSHSVDATHRSVVEQIEGNPFLRVEYFDIVDARTLLPVDSWEESPEIIGCITVYCGEVRLIDNIFYRK